MQPPPYRVGFEPPLLPPPPLYSRVITTGLVSVGIIGVSLGALWLVHLIDLVELDAIESRTIPAWVAPMETLLGAASSIARLVGAIVFMVWIHGAVTNTQAINRPMTVTPGWAIGWFFIPIASLYMPYKTMGELVTHSDPREIVITPPTVLAWWVLFVSGNGLRILAPPLRESIGTSGFVVLELLATLSLTGSLLALGSLMLTIHRGQEEFIRQLRKP
jgi:hypothetical protein